jgi:uncharacterized protein YdeI (YjbR/CyaY-like superfamily)
MAFPDDAPRAHFETTDEWRAWLEANHTTSSGLFVISWKKAAGRPAMTYEQSVEQALCFGWVDSRPAKLDDERTMLWFTPRKAGSGWARPNKERIERLTAAGLMHESGLAVVNQAKLDGSWEKLDAVERLEVPDDLAAALAEFDGARAIWDEFPRSVRRGILEWITQAKTAPTREKRVRETAEKASRGERANQWTPKPTPTD